MDQEITKEALEELYKSMKRDELCKHLNVNIPGLYKLLDNAGIPRKRPYVRRTKWEVK